MLDAAKQLCNRSRKLSYVTQAQEIHTMYTANTPRFIRVPHSLSRPTLLLPFFFILQQMMLSLIRFKSTFYIWITWHSTYSHSVTVCNKTIDIYRTDEHYTSHTLLLTRQNNSCVCICHRPASRGELLHKDMNLRMLQPARNFLIGRVRWRQVFFSKVLVSNVQQYCTRSERILTFWLRNFFFNFSTPVYKM